MNIRIMSHVEVYAILKTQRKMYSHIASWRQAWAREQD